MERNLLKLTLIGILGLGLAFSVVACEVEDDDDENGNGVTDTGPSDAGEQDAGVEAYRWVRICSIHEASPDDAYPGPDIDAVRVDPLDGSDVFFATGVGENTVPEFPPNRFSDPSEALGAPDTTSIQIGDEGANFVSIGLNGSYLILGFDQDILPGYEVTVYEIGVEFNPDARNELSKVSLGFSSTNEGVWIEGGQGSDEFTFTAPEFDGQQATCP